MVLVLAGLSYRVARRTTRAADQALLTAELQARLDAASAVPYDSLPRLAGCANQASGVTTVTSCLTLTPVVQNRTRITVVVYTSIPGTDTVTLSFDRTKTKFGIPTR